MPPEKEFWKDDNITINNNGYFSHVDFHAKIQKLPIYSSALFPSQNPQNFPQPQYQQMYPTKSYSQNINQSQQQLYPFLNDQINKDRVNFPRENKSQLNHLIDNPSENNDNLNEETKLSFFIKAWNKTKEATINAKEKTVFRFKAAGNKIKEKAVEISVLLIIYTISNLMWLKMLKVKQMLD